MKLFIVDLKNLAYRSYYAFSKNGLATKAGKPTALLFGLANALNIIIRNYKPECIIFAEDSKGETFRHKMYPLYKSTRSEIDPSLLMQLNDIPTLLSAFKIKTIKMEGYEADDLIGSLAMKFAPLAQVFIVSNDKDFMQLVGPNVSLCRPSNGGGFHIGKNELVAEKFGCGPNQVIDCLALMGDAADNVPGVKGIGPKIASDLIKAYGTLENIYGNVGVLKKSIGDKLLLSKDNALLSKQLVTIKTDIPIDLTLENLKIADNVLETEEVINLFKELEFESLLPQQSILGDD